MTSRDLQRDFLVVHERGLLVFLRHPAKDFDTRFTEFSKLHRTQPLGRPSNAGLGKNQGFCPGIESVEGQQQPSSEPVRVGYADLELFRCWIAECSSDPHTIGP